MTQAEGVDPGYSPALHRLLAIAAVRRSVFTRNALCSLYSHDSKRLDTLDVSNNCRLGIPQLDRTLRVQPRSRGVPKEP